MTDTPTQLPLFAPSEDEEIAAQIEARRLRPLAQLWTPEALSRSFLLSHDDLTQIRTCHGSHNRLGFALQLALIRFLHIVLPNFVRVPEPIIHFISLQLDSNPSALTTYAVRPQTRDDHVAQIRTYLGLRSYAAADSDALRTYLIQRAMHRDDAGVLIAEAEDWLRRARILFPAVSTLQRLVGYARLVEDAGAAPGCRGTDSAGGHAPAPACPDRCPGSSADALARSARLDLCLAEDRRTLGLGQRHRRTTGQTRRDPCTHQ